MTPYVTGLHRGLFDGPTTHQPTGHLVVFSLRHLPDEVKAAGTLLTLDAIWRRGLTVVTQDAADLLATDLGQAVGSNAATQILLRQAPQAIDRLAAAFHVIASDTEHRLVSSSPADLTALDRDADNGGVGG